jgi:beta-galactosidase
LETYKEDFYAGKPALTVNQYGKGRAYYITARTGDDFNRDFYGKIINTLGIKRALEMELPYGVTASKRGDYIFVINFGSTDITLNFPKEYMNVETGKNISGEIIMSKYQVMVLKSL